MRECQQINGHICNKASSTIVVDIGASTIDAGFTDSASPTISLPAPTSYRALLSAIKEVVDTLHASRSMSAPSIFVASPGLIDKSGRVHSALYSAVHNQDLRADLVSRLGKNVVLENDANAQALGLDPADSANSFYVTIGTATGGALVQANGGLWRGARNFAGEIGHLGGFSLHKCACGQTGCLDTVCSGWSIVRDAGAGWYETLNDLTAERVRAAGVGIGSATRYLQPVLDLHRVIICGKITGLSQFRVGVRSQFNGPVSYLNSQWLLTVKWATNKMEAER